MYAIRSYYESNWINDHNLNNLTDVNHLNDSQLNYLTTNIPNHINSSILHVPSPIGNNGKFLTTNGSVLSWGDGGLITLAGENYLSLTGSTLTAGKIALSNVSFTAGTNISLDTTLNTISAIQRGISDSPINSDSITGISAGWAYNHVNSFGNSGHVPLAGTIGHFLSWDGTYKDINVITSYSIHYTKLYEKRDPILNRSRLSVESPHSLQESLMS